MKEQEGKGKGDLILVWNFLKEFNQTIFFWVYPAAEYGAGGGGKKRKREYS